MAAAEETRARSRSRSPKAAENGNVTWLKDSRIQFFHAVDPANKHGQYVCTTIMPGPGPRLLKSHGWLEGTLMEDFKTEDFKGMNKDTWPLVRPDPSLRFADRSSHSKAGVVQDSRRIHIHHLRKPTSVAPLLSVVFVRWGGEDKVSGPNDQTEANDGDWGQYGAPASDEYMSAVVRQGFMTHPVLNGENKQFRFEIFSLFVKDSRDALAICNMMHFAVGYLKGDKKCSFWMMWPAEWEDCRGSDYAAYIERHAFYAGMRAFEAVGIRTAFPHPADQYEQITSKSWMATLSMQRQAQLPGGTMVSKDCVLTNPKKAAKDSLAILEYVRAQNPFPVDAERPSPSIVNKDGVRKGVVKLGWSWEARYVKIFNGEEDLAVKLSETLTDPGCKASNCIVQEWVDFDFEMRLYFLPTEDWRPPKRIEPTRIECNAWSGSMENGERRNFHKLNKEKIMADYWKGDEAAYENAKGQAIDIAQFLLGWLLLNNSQPMPMIRLDFMLLHLGEGKARVIFGEYCEMGACCLGWQEGPPTIWRAALDAALR